MNIPVEFWKSITAEEFSNILMAGELNKAQCEKVWRMTDRQCPPPDRLALSVNAADLMREFPAGSVSPTSKGRRG